MGGRDGSREAGYQGVAVLQVRNRGQGRVVAVEWWPMLPRTSVCLVLAHLSISVGFVSLIPGSGGSPGGGDGNPLQYFCLGNPMDRGA